MTPKRILLVDDDQNLCDLIELAILAATANTWEMKICYSGWDAVSMAPLFVPDLILLDVEMPTMNGLETLELLRKIPHTQHTPVILISGHTPNFHKPQGVLGHIQKPFSLNALLPQILALWQIGS